MLHSPAGLTLTLCGAVQVAAGADPRSDAFEQLSVVLMLLQVGDGGLWSR